MAGILCANCQAENPKGNRFCDTCGAKLAKAEEAEKVEKSRPAPAPKPARAEAAPAPARRNGHEEAGAPSAVAGLGLDKDTLWLIAITAFGLFLRLWDLGAKPLHHDESIHAWYAYKLFRGDAYHYDPAYHGPLRYHLNAWMFFIFGVSDFTTRLLPAILGTLTIAFVGSWTGLLGRTGARIAAAFIAISPTWVYVSRFIRDDINMALGELLVLWGLFKYFGERQPKHLYWAAAGFILAFASHEGTWIFMGIIGTFLFVRWLWEKFENSEPEANDLLPLFGDLTLLEQGGAAAQLTAAVFAPLTLLLGAFGVLKLRPGWKLWAGMLAIFFIPFTLFYSTFFTSMDGWFKGAFDSIAYWLGEQKTGRADRSWQFYIYMLSLYELAICAFAVFGGLRLYFGAGKSQVFFLKFAAFVPFALAIVILQNYPKDPRMVPLMAGLATVGSGLAAWSMFEARQGNHFKTFLIYWAMLAFVMFTIAGERMPWLTLHPLTPLTLLAATYLGEFFERDEPNLAEHWIGWAVLWLPISYFTVMGIFRQIPQAIVHAPKEVLAWARAFGHGGRHGSFQPSGWAVNAWDNKFLTTMPLVLFGVLVVCTYFILQRWPQLKRLTRGTWLGLLLLGLASLNHGTMNLVFQGDGADPREQHVYVQSTVELVELSAKLERMSRALTGGHYLKIAVEDLCSWPMSWYLRDLKNAQIGFGPPLTRDKAADFPVVMTGYENINQPNHDQVVADSFANSYNAYPVRFRRWWAPDENAFKSASFKDKVKKLWDIYVYREPWVAPPGIKNPQFQNYVYDKGDSIAGPYGSFDAVVWVRKDVDRYFQ